MKTSSSISWDCLAKIGDQNIDTSDILELGDVFLQNAELSVPVKKLVTRRLDVDELVRFRQEKRATVLE